LAVAPRGVAELAAATLKRRRLPLISRLSSSSNQIRRTGLGVNSARTARWRTSGLLRALQRHFVQHLGAIDGRLKLINRRTLEISRRKCRLLIESVNAQLPRGGVHKE
jgi:hypothetical protein